MQTGLAEKLFDLARAFRFGVVGLTASAAYFVIFNVTAAPIGPLAPFEAHLVALTISILVSYFGHHAYTFRLAGGHAFHFTKFAIVTAVLVVASSGLAYLLDRYGHYPAIVTSLVIVVFYPGASYLLHSLWTFGAARKPPKQAEGM